MDVEDVDVVRAQLLERRLERDRHRLDVVTHVVHLLRDVVRPAHHVRGVLQEKHNQRSISVSMTRAPQQTVVAPSSL